MISCTPSIDIKDDSALISTYSIVAGDLWYNVVHLKEEIERRGFCWSFDRKSCSGFTGKGALTFIILISFIYLNVFY